MTWKGLMPAFVAVALLSSATSGHAAEMTFSQPRECYLFCPMFADGEITLGTTERFKQFLNSIDQPSSNPGGLRRHWLYFNSPGGNVIEGVKLGFAIREAGLNTAVGTAGGPQIGIVSVTAPPRQRPGTCASACTIAFLGGLIRSVDDESRFGVHQFRSERPQANDMQVAQSTSAMLINYFKVMGANPELFDVWTRTAPSNIDFLSRQQLIALNVIASGETTRFEIRTGGRLDSLLAHDVYGDLVLGDMVFTCTQRGFAAQLSFDKRKLLPDLNSSHPVSADELHSYAVSWQLDAEVAEFEANPAITIMHEFTRRALGVSPPPSFPITDFDVVSHGENLDLQVPLSPPVPFDALLQANSLQLAVKSSASGHPIENRIHMTDEGRRLLRLLASSCPWKPNTK